MKIPKISIVIGAAIALMLILGAVSLIVATDNGSETTKCGCGCSGECKCAGSCATQAGTEGSTSKCSMSAGSGSCSASTGTCKS